MLYNPVVIVAAAENGTSAAQANPLGLSSGFCYERDSVTLHFISYNGYVYPTSYDHVISVGAVNHLVQSPVNDPVYGNTKWEDLILNDVFKPY